MKIAANYLMAGALLAAASLSVHAEATTVTAPVPGAYPAVAPFADAQAAYQFHKTMMEQQDKIFEAQRKHAEEMAKQFAANAPAKPDFGANRDAVIAQMEARHAEALKFMDEQRKQAETVAAQYRQAAFPPAMTTPVAYQTPNETRPFAPVMDPARDPAKVQAQFDEYRKQMEAQRAEMVKRADEQRKAAEEQHAVMRKEMEAFRTNRKI